MVSTRDARKLAGAALAVLVAAGCAGNSPDVPAGPDGQVDPILASGRDIYEKRCASCHGSAGEGGTGSRLNDGEALAAYPDADDMAAIIAEGDGRSMPAFGGSLSPEEITAVNRYVREVLNAS